MKTISNAPGYAICSRRIEWADRDLVHICTRDDTTVYPHQAARSRSTILARPAEASGSAKARTLR